MSLKVGETKKHLATLHHSARELTTTNLSKFTGGVLHCETCSRESLCYSTPVPKMQTKNSAYVPINDSLDTDVFTSTHTPRRVLT